MPFDPNLPLNGSRATAAELRSQFTGLKDLIDSMGSITSAVVDAVNTLPAGTPAAVSMNVIGSELHFTFGIPQGSDGPTGATGQPGEVSLTDLNNAQLSTLSQCSNNSNGVGTLGFAVSDPPTQSEMQQVLSKVDELIQALRR
jgi:hypothetical protein